MEPVFGNFQNLCAVNEGFDYFRIEKYVADYVKWSFFNDNHRSVLNILLYIYIYERPASEASSNVNILGMNANMAIIFLGFTRLKRISRNKTFQNRKSNIKIKGLPGDHDT